MHRPALWLTFLAVFRACGGAALSRSRGLGLWAAGLLLSALLAAPPARAEAVNLPVFAMTRSEEGLMLDFSAKFELSRVVDDALQKGVPLLFVAEATVFQSRWYWRDKEINHVKRSWRLSYQPLTRKYRVTFGGLTQNHDSLADALAALSSSVHWKLAEPAQFDGGGIYVEFSYELDTTQLPRPMQIGIGGQPDWALRVERLRRLN